MSDRLSDNEWAAEVMGWREMSSISYIKPNGSSLGKFDWSPDTDANDFRDLLNCEAVRDAVPWALLSTIIINAMLQGPKRAGAYDQPAALRRLREAMEEQK